MVDAPESQQITPALHLWQSFDPSVKTDLFSTAALVGHALFIIDPIPLAPKPWRELNFGGQLTAILVTNANHVRSSADLAQAAKVPVYCAPEAAGEFGALEIVPLSQGMEIAASVSAIALEGAVPGEFAFHFAGDGGTIVVGDALIHLGPYGFSLLPAKYCQNQKKLRRSLRQLLDWSFERLLFAHGTPLLSGARERLETLLR
jgi:hypothetical protein